jgi:glycine betaine catabolism B
MSEDFVKVAESKDIEPSSMKAVDVAVKKVCIVNVCTHVGGPLDEETLEGY